MHSEVFVFFLLKAFLLLSVQGSTTETEKVAVPKASIGEHSVQTNTKVFKNQSTEEHLKKSVTKPLDNQSHKGVIINHFNESFKHDILNMKNISLAEIDNKTEITTDGNNLKSSTMLKMLPQNTTTTSSTESTKTVTIISNNQTSAMNYNHSTLSPSTALNSSSPTPSNPTSNIITEKLSSSTMASTSKNLDNTTPLPQTRQFDGPSFIGGIVLTVGLTAIGFIAFKFYKADRSVKSENYRKL